MLSNTGCYQNSVSTPWVLQGTRDYNVGQSVDPIVAEVANDLGIPLPLGFASRTCNHVEDVVKFDMILVMDKFTASDFLKEVRRADCISACAPCKFLQGAHTFSVHECCHTTILYLICSFVVVPG